MPKLLPAGVDCLARILPIALSMALPNASTDALIEILSFCEQALTALHSCKVADEFIPRSTKSRHSRQDKATNVVRHLHLIPGGRSNTSEGSLARPIVP